MDLSVCPAADTGFKELVRRSFIIGMDELQALAKCLHKAEEDPAMYLEVKEHVENASKEFALAEALNQAELGKVDSQCEELMMKKKKLQDEKKAKGESLKDLKSKLSTSVELREANMATINNLTDSIQEMQQRQADVENKAETQRSRRTTALWSMLIPGVGTIIGGVVAIGSHLALKKTEEEVVALQGIITEHKLHVETYSKEVEKYSKLVEEHEASIRDCERGLLEIEKQEEQRRVLHNQTLQLQEQLRRATHFLSTLTGKAHVADITTRYICDHENLSCILADMERHVLPLLTAPSIDTQRLELLSSPEITNSIRKLKCLSEPQNIFRKIFYEVEKYLPFGERFSIHYFSFVILFLFFIRFSFFLITSLFLSLVRFSFFLISSPWFYICLILFYILINKCLPRHSKQKCK